MGRESERAVSVGEYQASFSVNPNQAEQLLPTLAGAHPVAGLGLDAQQMAFNRTITHVGVVLGYGGRLELGAYAGSFSAMSDRVLEQAKP